MLLEIFLVDVIEIKLADFRLIGSREYPTLPLDKFQVLTLFYSHSKFLVLNLIKKNSKQAIISLFWVHFGPSVYQHIS